MKVNVNGKETLTSAHTVAELIGELNIPGNGVAVGLGGKIVRRTEWDTPALSEGAEVVIIKAACGG